MLHLFSRILGRKRPVNQNQEVFRLESYTFADIFDHLSTEDLIRHYELQSLEPTGLRIALERRLSGCLAYGISPGANEKGTENQLAAYIFEGSSFLIPCRNWMYRDAAPYTHRVILVLPKLWGGIDRFPDTITRETGVSYQTFWSIVTQRFSDEREERKERHVESVTEPMGKELRFVGLKGVNLNVFLKNVSLSEMTLSRVVFDAMRNVVEQKQLAEFLHNVTVHVKEIHLVGVTSDSFIANVFEALAADLSNVKFIFMATTNLREDRIGEAITRFCTARKAKISIYTTPERMRQFAASQYINLFVFNS